MAPPHIFIIYQDMRGNSVKFYDTASKELRQHIFNYSKTRDTYFAYKESGYSKEFFEAHREALILHKAAKEAFKKIDGPIPKVKDLDKEFQKLTQAKRKFYSKYKPAKEERQELLMAKQNVERFLETKNMKEQDIKKSKNRLSL